MGVMGELMGRHPAALPVRDSGLFAAYVATTAKSSVQELNPSRQRTESNVEPSGTEKHEQQPD